MPVGKWCPGPTTRLRNDGCSQLYSIRLTFREPETERVFLKHVTEDIPRWMFWYSTIIFSVAGLGILSLRPWHWDTTSLDFFYPGAFLDVFAVYTAVGSFMLCNMAAAMTPRLMRRISFYVFELYILFVALLLVCVIIMSHPVYMGALRGHADVEWEDTSALLFLAGLVLGAHMAPCIRWHMLVPVQLAAVSVYCAAIHTRYGLDFFGKHERYAVQLACLVALASFGKRRNQFHERLSFSSLIAERTSRATTEFRLEQQTAVRSANRAVDARSMAESVPTTTDTGRAFRLPAESAHAWGALREIGRREQWLIGSGDLSWDPEHILGVGGFGIVIQGVYQGVSVAVKLPKEPGRPGQSASHIAELCNELQILRRLRHPNCVVFFGAWLDEEHDDLALVLELVRGVSLKQFVGESPAERIRALVLAQVSCALVYLHAQSPKVVHADLKDTNIFVESGGGGDPVAKLLDFGLARRLTKSEPRLGGSLAWMAPEVAQAGAASPAADVFSFGRVMYFVATGESPDGGRSPTSLIVELKNGRVPPLAWPDADAFADECRTIVERCSEASPAVRPTSSEVHEAAVQICGSRSNTPGKFRQVGGGTREALLWDLGEIRRAAKEWRPPGAKPLGLSGLWQRQAPPAASDPADSRPTGGGGTRFYPGFEVTKASTVVDAILPALMRFNFDMPPGACCQFHAALQNMQQMERSLISQSCLRIGLEAVAQCRRCGAIITNEDCDSSGTVEVGVQECYFCGEPVGGPQVDL